MQGSKTTFIVTASAALAGLALGGCTVHNYPPPPSPAEQERLREQHVQQQPPPRAQAAQNPKRAPAPATRNTAAAPAPVPPPPPPQQQAPQPAAEGRSYTVKPGDNLWNIAKEVYGDGTKYQRILDANPGLNPDHMKPGTKIIIP